MEKIKTIGIGRKECDIYVNPIMQSPYYIGCARSHAAAAEIALQSKGPFLILEADATRTGFEIPSPWPEDADCVYAGLSRYCIEGRESYLYKIYNKDYVRLFNMLGAHAVILISERYKRFHFECSKYSRGYADIDLARGMKNFNVYALRKPLYFQGPETNYNHWGTNWIIK